MGTRNTIKAANALCAKAPFIDLEIVPTSTSGGNSSDGIPSEALSSRGTPNERRRDHIREQIGFDLL